ncbi:MAG TPA: EutN/CcmL family microcompartment protein [Kiritimatiellia bacterium]|nr:EutN/CcmL family microcompartment protein [Kiritimatiellia bacterium]
MITGRVIGSIYSTINHPFYDGKKLMIVEKTDPQGMATGDYLIAIDSVGAGPGEPVLVLDEGNGARQVIGDNEAPLRSIIVGIIDHVG